MPAWMRPSKELRRHRLVVDRSSVIHQQNLIAAGSVGVGCSDFRDCSAAVVQTWFSGVRHGSVDGPGMTKDVWLTTKECAERVGLSRQTISSYCKSGRIKAIAINTGPRPIYRIRESDFRAFVREWIRDE
jgi:DNA binding domain, excisionase family